MSMRMLFADRDDSLCFCQVAVVSPCTSPSTLCVERTQAACAGQPILQCAICTTCMDDSCLPCPTGAEEAVYVAPPPPIYVPPVDTEPPVLTLLGSGQLAVTPTGVKIMIDTVQLFGAWVHAGVGAWDEEDGDLTSQVSRSV